MDANALFASRVRAAAGAGWWTILIAALWMTGAWLVWLWILSAQPGWAAALWGGKIDWDQIRALMIKFFALSKLVLFLAAMTVIWLSLWARKLKRLAA
jgi:hypothetical protein